MEQQREHASLMDSGMGLIQLVKVRFWRAAINRTFVHVTICIVNVCVAFVHAVYACLGTYVALLLAMSISVGVSCGHPGILRFGRVDTSAGTSFGDVARYSCDVGYTLNGAAERTCQADGQWNGTEPTCEGETL